MENKILATVNGSPIYEVEVDEFLEGLGQRGAAYNNPQGREIILQQIINSRLFLIDAQKNLLEADPAFTAQLRKLKAQLLTNFAVDKYLSSVKVTDEEVEAFYNEHPEAFMQGETVNASHILVATEEEALDIYAKITSGEMTFEDAAMQFSTCPSKENGGSLGDFGQGQMVAEFDTAVFAMEVGEITATPVKTQFGYHLIRLNGKNPAKTVALEEIREPLKAKILEDKQQQAYESRVGQLKIVYPVEIVAEEQK